MYVVLAALVGGSGLLVERQSNFAIDVPIDARHDGLERCVRAAALLTKCIPGPFDSGQGCECQCGPSATVQAPIELVSKERFIFRAETI